MNFIKYGSAATKLQELAVNVIDNKQCTSSHSYGRYSQGSKSLRLKSEISAKIRAVPQA